MRNKAIVVVATACVGLLLSGCDSAPAAAPKPSTITQTVTAPPVTTTVTPSPVTSTATSTITDTVTETVTSSPISMPFLVEPKDVEIDLDVVSQQCFGSAGCNVTVEPSLTPKSVFAEAGGYRVTYEVSGDEDGKVIETLDVDTDGTYSFHPIHLSTASSGVVPKAKVTKIRPHVS